MRHSDRAGFKAQETVTDIDVGCSPSFESINVSDQTPASWVAGTSSLNCTLLAVALTPVAAICLPFKEIFTPLMRSSPLPWIEKSSGPFPRVQIVGLRLSIAGRSVLVVARS